MAESSLRPFVVEEPGSSHFEVKKVEVDASFSSKEAPNDFDNKWLITAHNRVRTRSLIDFNKVRPSINGKINDVANLKIDILSSITEVFQEDTFTKCLVTLQLEGINLLNFQYHCKRYDVHKIWTSIRDKEKKTILSEEEIPCNKSITRSSGSVGILINLVDVQKLETRLEQANVSETVIVEIKVELQSFNIQTQYCY